jgi:hypothetical protein
VRPDPIAYRDDISHIADLLEEAPDGHTLDYIAQFLSGVAGDAGDEALLAAARRLALTRQTGASSSSDRAQIAGLIQSRLAERLAI